MFCIVGSFFFFFFFLFVCHCFVVFLLLFFSFFYIAFSLAYVMNMEFFAKDLSGTTSTGI